MRKVRILLNFRFWLHKCDNISRITTKNENIVHKFKYYKREKYDFLKNQTISVQ